MKFSRLTFLALILGVFIAVVSPTAQGAADEFGDGAHKFIRSLADQAMTSLTDKKLNEADRQSNFRKLLSEYFDVSSLGKWVLGRYWRRASKVERAEYLNLFEDLIVGTYANRFREYTTEMLSISNTTSLGNSAIVHSLMERKDDKGLRVDWRVKFPDGRYKIVDIMIEGVSMAQTQRSEFSSVIRRNGGKVSGLISALRGKTEKLLTQSN